MNAKEIIYQITRTSFLIIIKQSKERNLKKNNRTPLHLALDKKLETIGELLILKGADINIKNTIYPILENHFSSK